MHLLFRSSLALMLSSMVATNAMSSVMRYDSAGAFSAAAPTAISYGFEGIATPTALHVGAVTVGGITFDSSGFAFVIDNTYSGGVYGASFFSGQSSTAAPSDALVSLAGAYAIGFNFGGYVTTAGTPVQIDLSTGDHYVASIAPYKNTNFIGFVSTDPITSVKLFTIDNTNTSNQVGYTMDIVSFSVASALPVPEPATYALLIAGLGVVGAVGRRKAH